MKLLVAVDFTEVTNPLIKLAKLIAKAHNAKLTLLHTVSPALYIPYPESFGMNVVDLELISQMQKNKLEEAKTKLEALRDYLKPIEAEVIAEIGDAAESILAKEGEFDLLLMAAHKKSLIERILIGSTTEKVAKYTKKPLLILKGREVEDIKKVCIAYDFSKNSHQAFEFSLDFLKPFSPQVRIIHVEETIELPIIDSIKDSIVEQYRQEKRNHLEKLIQELKEAGMEATYSIETSESPVKGIIDYVEKENPDLVILGSRGLSSLERVLMGSTTSELLRKLQLPLLIHRGP